MSEITTPFFAGQKATLENLLAAQGTFFEGFEKLTDLNLKVTKALFEDVAQKSREAVELKTPHEALTFITSLARTEQAVAYGKQVHDILSALRNDLRVVAETQLTEGRKQVSDAVENISRNAPTGSEGAVALLKSSIATATDTYDTVSKVARQAADAAESNVAAATDATLKAAESATQSTAPSTKKAARSERTAD